ncbi:hypothetical protein OG790_05775 [Streptomyces cellulosae]
MGDLADIDLQQTVGDIKKQAGGRRDGALPVFLAHGRPGGARNQAGSHV